MNRRKTLKRAVKSKITSVKESSESDSNSSDKESGNSSIALLDILLSSLQKTPQRKKLKRRISKKYKRKRSTCNDLNDDALTGCLRLNTPECCSHCKKKKKKSNCRCSKQGISTINVESDEEKINENVGDSHLRNIESKVDNFFKSANLESDDEEDVKVDKKDEDPIPKKPKDFYMVISDSDDEIVVEKPSTSADNVIPGTSDIHISSENNIVHKNKDELMDLVDSILQPDDDQFQKVSKPDDNWEDYKKKTEEMLGSVSVLIHDLKENKMEEPVPKEKPVLKEVMTPSCPVCLETLGANEAAATFCGHIFCKTCITHIAKTTKKCPTCRKNVNLKKIHPVYF